MAHLTQQELWLAIRAFNKALVEQGYQPCVKVVNTEHHRSKSDRLLVRMFVSVKDRKPPE